MSAANRSLKRHPRFRRIAALSECVLTSRDLDILTRVESYRLVTSEQLQALIPAAAEAGPRSGTSG